MDTIRQFFGVLLAEVERRIDFDADPLRRWFADRGRRRLTYAGSMLLLSAVILLTYACSQRPDV